VPGKASHSPVAADSWRPLDATEPALESEKAPKYRVSLGWSERNFLSLRGCRGLLVINSDVGAMRPERKFLSVGLRNGELIPAGLLARTSLQPIVASRTERLESVGG